MAIVVIMVINVLLGGMVWRNLFTRPKFDVVIGEDAMVIIGELDNYYHQEVQLLNASQLDYHVIEIYVFNSTCNFLPTTTKVISYERSNISENQKFNHLYLLPKSTLNYTITPSIKVNGSESVKGCVYVTLGPELNLTDPFNLITCDGHNSDCIIEDHKPLNFTDQESIKYFYKVKKRGYYNLHIIAQDQRRSSLRLTVNASVVSVNTTEQAAYNIEDRDGDNGSMTCAIVPLKFRNGETCLVAYTKIENSSHPYYIKLEARVTEMQTLMVLVTTIVPSVMFALILICIIFAGYCCCKIRLKSRKYKALVNEELLSTIQ